MNRSRLGEAREWAVPPRTTRDNTARGGSVRAMPSCRERGALRLERPLPVVALVVELYVRPLAVIRVTRDAEGIDVPTDALARVDDVAKRQRSMYELRAPARSVEGLVAGVALAEADRGANSVVACVERYRRLFRAKELANQWSQLAERPAGLAAEDSGDRLHLPVVAID